MERGKKKKERKNPKCFGRKDLFYHDTQKTRSPLDAVAEPHRIRKQQELTITTVNQTNCTHIITRFKFGFVVLIMNSGCLLALFFRGCEGASPSLSLTVSLALSLALLGHSHSNRLTKKNKTHMNDKILRDTFTHLLHPRYKATTRDMHPSARATYLIASLIYVLIIGDKSAVASAKCRKPSSGGSVCPKGGLF